MPLLATLSLASGILLMLIARFCLDWLFTP